MRRSMTEGSGRRRTPPWARPSIGRAHALSGFVVGLSLLVGCTDDSVTFDERDPFDPPPGATFGFLGYSAGDAGTGMTVCGNCHVGTDAAWAATDHAGAWETLRESGHAQSFCEGCHLSLIHI